MTIQPITRPARGDEIDALLDVILSANPHIKARVNTFRATGSYWHEATPIVCEVAGHIVSCAIVFHRQVRAGAESVRFAGIGAVATHPSVRGRGYATTVMSECEMFARTQGYRFGVLFCTIVNFYQRIGWVPIEEDYVKFLLKEIGPVAEPCQHRLVPLGSGPMPPATRKLYHEAPEEGAGAIVRNDEVWEEYARWPRDEPDLAWAAFDQVDPIAYVRAKRCEEGGILLMDSACRPGQESALLTLLQRQREVVSQSRPALFQAYLARTHPLARVLKEQDIEMVWQKTSAQTSMMMIKPMQDTNPGHRPQMLGGRWLLTATGFQDHLPWWPRTWWAIDRL